MSNREPIVFGGYTQAELDAQYDQRSLVPDVTPYLTFWSEESRKVRESLECVIDVSYGPSEEEKLDIFPPSASSAPVHVNLHGGAWRMLTKEHAGFPARNLFPAGACYVALNFALATQVTIDEMVRQVRSAMAWIYANIADYGGDPARIFVSGHSSGAHLTGMLLATGWRPGAGLPEDLIKGAILLSGTYDLEPVRLSARNRYLHLDEGAARRNSPIHLIPDHGPPIFAGWGEGELDEFKRQGKGFAAAWAKKGLAVTVEEFQGYNHFDVSSAFADPSSPIVRAALAQMSLA